MGWTFCDGSRGASGTHRSIHWMGYDSSQPLLSGFIALGQLPPSIFFPLESHTMNSLHRGGRFFGLAHPRRGQAHGVGFSPCCGCFFGLKNFLGTSMGRHRLGFRVPHQSILDHGCRLGIAMAIEQRPWTIIAIAGWWLSPAEWIPAPTKPVGMDPIA